MLSLHEEEEEEEGGGTKKERRGGRREHSYKESCYTSQYLVHLGTLSQQHVLYILKHLNRKVSPYHNTTPGSPEYEARGVIIYHD